MKDLWHSIHGGVLPWVSANIHLIQPLRMFSVASKKLISLGLICFDPAGWTREGHNAVHSLSATPPTCPNQYPEHFYHTEFNFTWIWFSPCSDKYVAHKSKMEFAKIPSTSFIFPERSGRAQFVFWKHKFCQANSLACLRRQNVFTVNSSLRFQLKPASQIQSSQNIIFCGRIWNSLWLVKQSWGSFQSHTLRLFVLAICLRVLAGLKDSRSAKYTVLRKVRRRLP